MRTATSMGRTASGWILISGPDVPADRQRAAFNSGNWPDGIEEVRFQFSDSAAKSRTRDDVTKAANALKHAEKKAEEKRLISERKTLEAKKEQEEKEKRAAAENKQLIADKEAAKAKVREQEEAAARASAPAPKTKSK